MAEESNNPKEVGVAVLYFGTKKQDVAWGLCDDISEKPMRDKDVVEDGDGLDVGLIYSKPRIEVSLNFTLIKQAAAGPTPATNDDLIGESMTITKLDGTELKIYIDTCERKGTRKGKATFAVTGTHHPGVVEA